jgi:4-amino-4-deoxy-L-arabinose transferase-like glycosyltransferase
VTASVWRWMARVPAAAYGLVLLFLGLIVFVATQAHTYGRTYDEVFQQDYGKRVLAWYLSGGHDRGFLDYPSWEQMPQHGPFAETVIAAVQRLTGEDWTTRSVVTGAFAILGVLAVALCGYELGGWWAAFLSAAGLALFPRYLGAALNNSKDVPFAAAMTFVLWAVLRLMRRWDEPTRDQVWASAGIGVAIGAAASIRVVGVIWYPILGLLAIGWWLRHPSALRQRKAGLAALGNQAMSGLIIGITSFATMCALWPYVAINPVSNLTDSIVSMSKYPWGGIIPFEGHMISAQQLPRWYVLEWLGIGSPVPVAILGAVGVVLAAVQLARFRTGDSRLALVLLSFAAPALMLAALRSTMYNGLRQFLFIVPALVVMASYALIWLWQRLDAISGRAVLQPVLAAVVGVLVVGGQAQAVGEMVRLHPYEYAYFSPLVGGFGAATTRYELDYWGTCNKPAAEWLARNESRFRKADGQPLTVTGAAMDTQYMLYLPPGQFVSAGDGADVYIWSMRERTPDQYPTYIPVHVVSIEGYAACEVKVRPDISVGHTP